MTIQFLQRFYRLCLCLIILSPLAGFSAVRLERDHDVVKFLSWDTENGERTNRNLLLPGTGLHLRVQRGDKWLTTADLRNAEGSNYVNWQITEHRGSVDFKISATGKGWTEVRALELVFPFDPRVTPTTVLPKTWNDDGTLILPAIINAPDFGQMLLSSEGKRPLRARLEGSRAQHTVQLIVELPVLRDKERCALSMKPIQLPAPRKLKDKVLWASARRGWFGALQCSAKWGDPGNPYSAPAGMLANNVISDPASSALWFYADQAFWAPQLAPEINVMTTVRRTLDWWLDNKMLPDGEMICYWDKAHFLDANSGPLIAAWDYFESTHDRTWLVRRIETLEKMAEYLTRRDVDGDGLVEAIQSGNYGTLQEPARSCAWWDALNCGHKDSYSNALIYRAWRCLADLEGSLNRDQQRARYTQLADRLKANFYTTLYNPKTGWLAWWKSADGVLHDYASPVINGLAIEYGLVEPATGREILARLRTKMEEAGFTRFDLGVPPMLVPVRRADYLLPNAIGCPQREDGTDTFGYYMNGAITAGQVLHFLAAHYVVGDGSHADKILRAMLQRQAHGGFQNGAVNAYPQGIDWTTWDGKPAGYEGYLADSFRFLQAVLLREPEFRNRLYHPLSTPPTRQLR